MPEQGRGRRADRPSGIPARGWGDVAKRVYKEISDDNLSIIAAGVAFYGIMALFPALAALVAIYGLIADPQQVQQQLQGFSGMLPGEVQSIVSQQLQNLAGSSGTALSLSLVASILIALWSSMQGTKAIMTGLNVVYDEDEQRGFLKLNAVAFALTLGGILAVVVAIGLVAVLPAVLNFIGLGEGLRQVISWLRWPLLAVFVIVALAVVYRYAPSRDRPEWRWVSWGAVIAAVLWLIGSGLFSFYVSNFGNYNETYGSLGAVIVLLLWLFLTGFAVLLGGELNAELEHQTERDTTIGAHEPMGERGARMADTVGRAANEPGEPPDQERRRGERRR